jgi:hypothetical protein
MGGCPATTVSLYVLAQAEPIGKLKTRAASMTINNAFFHIFILGLLFLKHMFLFTNSQRFTIAITLFRLSRYLRYMFTAEPQRALRKAYFFLSVERTERKILYPHGLNTLARISDA